MASFRSLLTSAVSGPLKALGRAISGAAHSAQPAGRRRGTAFTTGRNAILGGLLGASLARGMGAGGATMVAGLAALAKSASTAATALGLLQRAARARRQAGTFNPGTPSLSSLATKPGNFGAILSGKTTAQQVVQHAHQGQATRARRAAQVASGRATAAALTGLGVAAAGAVVALVAIPIAGAKWAQSLAEGNRNLSRFNSQIALAFSGLERDRLIRARQSGASVSGSTSALNEAVSGMEEELRPIKDAATNIKNTLGTGFAILATHLSKLVGIGEWFKSFNDKWFGKSPQSRTDWDDLFRRLRVQTPERRKHAEDVRKGGRKP